MKLKRSAAACAALCAAILTAGCMPVSERPAESLPQTILNMNTAEGYVSPVYDALTEEEKNLYDTIKNAVLEFNESAELGKAVPKDELRKIYKLVYSQERDLFWLSSLFYAPDDKISTLRLNYIYTKDDAALKRAELDLKASEIIGELPENISDAEKVIYFHDKIVTGCDFSQSAEHVNSAYGVLVAGAGQCEGYAAAMSLLCNKAGIPNYTVCGTNSSGDTHAWNKVMVGGNWYNVDCTWDDPILNHYNADFLKHDYCLVSDKEIIGVTHFPDELYKNVPPCTAEEMNYFAVKGLVFNTAADACAELKEQIRSAGLSGKREAELRLSGADPYYAVIARLFDSGEIKQMIEDINGNYGTKIRSAYDHNNDKLNIVHISLIYENDE